MDAVYKHKIYCETDGKWEYILSEDETLPTVCPTNAAHTVGTAVTSDFIKKEIIGTELLTGKTSDKMKLRGTTFIAAKGVSTSHNFDINESFFIKDGSLVTEKNIVGDTVDISLHLQDDTLLYEYVKGYPISNLKETGFVDQTLSDTNFNSMRLKVTYHSTGTTDDVIVGLQLNGQD